MLPLRSYAIPFAASAQAGAIDWFELIAGANDGLALLGLDIGQTTELGDSAEEQIDWYIKRASGSYTSGSGGSSPTPVAVRSADAAATFTTEVLNTTKIAVGTGTLTTVHQGAFNVRVGLQIFWTPETAITCKASEALAVGMTGTPADSITWVGTAYVADTIL